MSLLFCCPSCGAGLRVNPAAAASVSCPACGELVRVPRLPHPREAATDAPPLPAHFRTAVARGLGLLTFSVWAFVSAAGCVAVSFFLRVCVGRLPVEEYPLWLPPLQVSLAGWWVLFAAAGCVCRARGYLLCRPTAHRYDLGPWATAAAVGALLAVIGAVAVMPAVIGRPVVVALPTTGAGVLLIGLSLGLAGVLLEFAFMPVLNRVLWETVGWQAAAQTGRYAVTFVCGVVAVMGVLCLGVAAVVLTSGGNDGRPDAGVSTSAKGIAVGVILGVCGIAGWLTWRFLRLLKLTREAISRPESTPDRTPV